MEKPSVLLIAADDPLRSALAVSLEHSGFEVTLAPDGQSGIDLTLARSPDVVLISSDLVDPDTEKVCSRVRQSLPRESAPLFVLIPEACALEQPVPLPHDHATRSIDLNQFAQGIATLASSTSGNGISQRHVVTEGLHLDRSSFRCEVDSREVRLTPTEFRILWELARQPGAVLSRQELCEECRNNPEVRRCRSVDVHIRSLRIKLRERAHLIETVRGIGYRLNASVTSEVDPTVPTVV